MHGGMQVYYGNPTCCAWSADGACLAAGGEDDLVTVFSLAKQRVVAWCEGHTSWVTAVRFDPWCVPSMLTSRVYWKQLSVNGIGAGFARGAASWCQAPCGYCTYCIASWIALSRAKQQKSEASLEKSTSSTDMEEDGAAAASPVEEGAPSDRTYRVASLGQDCHICMWDVRIPEQHALQPTTRSVRPPPVQP